MRAIVRTEYGSPDVLRLEDVAKPVPEDGEVRIEVHATSVNKADVYILRGEPFFMRLFIGLRKPKYRIPGADVAGHVDAVGSGVERLQPGNEVFGDLSGCGFGAYAEYACAPEDALARKPGGLSFEQAASVPMAAVTALQALRDRGRTRPGQHVLISGASGGVGTFAVQIAKSFGAEVTATCSAGKMDMVRSLGADHVVDYAREDVTRNEGRYDLILGVNGYYPILAYRRALRLGGRYVVIGGSPAQVAQGMLLGPWLSLAGSRKLGGMMARPNRDDLAFLAGLLEAGTVVPVIDRRHALAEAADAMRCVGAGHARGKVVIAVRD